MVDGRATSRPAWDHPVVLLLRPTSGRSSPVVSTIRKLDCSIGRAHPECPRCGPARVADEELRGLIAYARDKFAAARCEARPEAGSSAARAEEVVCAEPMLHRKNKRRRSLRQPCHGITPAMGSKATAFSRRLDAAPRITPPARGQVMLET